MLEVLTGHGRMLTQGALCWIWARSPVTIPIPGFRNIAQLKENIAAMDHGPLDGKEMTTIHELLARSEGA